MLTHSVKKLLLSILIVVLILNSFPVFSQTAAEERAALEQQLKELEEEIAKIDEDVERTEQEKKTLENQIYLLQSKIKKLDLQIYQGNVMIEDLGVQVVETEKSIEEKSFEIKESRKHLAETLQLIHESDKKSLIEILLSEEKISDFFSDLVALESLNQKSQELLESVENLKSQLETEKENLDKEKQDLEDLVVIQSLQRQESASIKKDKDWLLDLTEAEYDKYVQQKQETEKKAAEIRARIFDLIGVPEAPTFGEAYEIAKYVSNITGVRPALLLAVLTQESNIGKNVGQCYLKNPATGSGVVAYNGKAVNKVMKPSRDVGHFLDITQSLGRDPYNTPVSCPMQYGWGGAMGPAQFIPSTWTLYKDRLAAITGSAADPWNIRDAFLAAAVYLADLGATKQTYEYEWCAALSYFAGSCSLSNQVRYEFYGDSVMALAKQYEEDIAKIQ